MSTTFEVQLIMLAQVIAANCAVVVGSKAIKEDVIVGLFQSISNGIIEKDISASLAAWDKARYAAKSTPSMSKEERCIFTTKKGTQCIRKILTTEEQKQYCKLHWKKMRDAAEKKEETPSLIPILKCTAICISGNPCRNKTFEGGLCKTHSCKRDPLEREPHLENCCGTKKDGSPCTKKSRKQSRFCFVHDLSKEEGKSSSKKKKEGDRKGTESEQDDVSNAAVEPMQNDVSGITENLCKGKMVSGNQCTKRAIEGLQYCSDHNNEMYLDAAVAEFNILEFNIPKQKPKEYELNSKKTLVSSRNYITLIPYHHVKVKKELKCILKNETMCIFSYRKKTKPMFILSHSDVDESNKFTVKFIVDAFEALRKHYNTPEEPDWTFRFEERRKEGHMAIQICYGEAPADQALAEPQEAPAD